MNPQEINKIETRTTKRPKWWRYILGTIAFWLLSIFGGTIPMLINALQPQFARYMPGDLGYEILFVSATAIGCFIAVAAFNAITEHNAPICGFVNCMIALLFFIFLFVSTFFTGLATLGRIIAYVLVIVVYVYAIFKFANSAKTGSGKKEH